MGDGDVDGWKEGGRVTGCSRWLLLRGRWCCCVEKGVNAKSGKRGSVESEVGKRDLFRGEAAGEQLLCTGCQLSVLAILNDACLSLSRTLVLIRCRQREMFASRCSLVSFVSIYYCDIADANICFIRAGPWRTCLCRCLLRGEFSAWSWVDG